MARPALERISQREYARRLGVSNEAVSRAVKEGRIKKGWDPKEKKIIVHHANAEWGDFHIQQNAKKIVNAPPSSPPPDDDGRNQSAGSGESGALNNNTSYANAKRVKEIATASLAVLELKQKKSELVEKAMIYKKLRDFGVSLRNEIMNVPNLCIDDIMSAKTRAEANMILTTALHNVLERVTSNNVDIE